MKVMMWIGLVFVLNAIGGLVGIGAEALPPSVAQQLAALDVAWDTPGGEMASMPVGNGDITANVWLESNGDVMFYLGKSDAWNELSCLSKVGRVRISFSPALSTNLFTQRLDLRSGMVMVSSGAGAEQVKLRVWVDANNPVLRVEQEGGVPRTCIAKVELWRTQDLPLSNSYGTHTEQNITVSGATIKRLADTVIPPKSGDTQILWCHRNTESFYPVNLKVEHLESLLAKYPDPLLNRTFGAAAFGTGMKAVAPLTLESTAPAGTRMLSFVLLTAQTQTLEAWTAQTRELTDRMAALSIPDTRSAHAVWWEGFWNRSHLFVSGDKDANTVTRGYTLQRYMIGASSRGKYPPKFNGGAFNVNMTGRFPHATSPDYRSWGGNCYWFQNNRFLSWPSLASGDYDMMLPFFNMYRDMLPFRRDVTKTYFGHEGAHFVETFHFWGSHGGTDFGWKNPTTTPQNIYVRWYWQGGIELVTMMLDYYAHTRDDAFAKETLLPIADAVATFYDQHWKRDAKGKICFNPTASLETFDAINDAPTIAGLNGILPRLIALPEKLATAAQRAAWEKTLADLPPLPTVIEGGRTRLVPADKYWGTRNMENPELYAVFPYRLYGMGLPSLQVAKDTFAARRQRHQYCWSQDCIDAAQLGLTAEARSRTVGKFSAPSAPQRFPAFWNPNWNFDWTPDMDHGGSAALALGEMLMQCPGEKIILMPAWPKSWRADFKLHAPRNTILEGCVEGGKMIELKVTPESRRKDVEIIEQPPAGLAEGKPARASSQWDGDYSADKAFDGDQDTRWSTAAGQKTGWLEVDLGKPVAVSHVVINEGWDRIRKFSFQCQVGNDWKPIVEGTTIGANREFKFNPVTAQKFRLEILDSREPAPTIYEMQLY